MNAASAPTTWLKYRSDAYIVADQGGPMYFCNARCLSMWALNFATKPNRPEEQKRSLSA